MITLGAVLIFLFGLAYSENTLVKKPAPAAASNLLSKQIDDVCGIPDSSNSLCYEQVVYRGFPAKAIVYKQDSEGNWQDPSVLGWRGSGVFGAIIINSLVISVFVFLTKFLASRIKPVS